MWRWAAMPGWRCRRDAGTALTRDGSLAISNTGILTDSAGNPVLGTGGQPISLPQPGQAADRQRRHDLRRAGRQPRRRRRRSMGRSPGRDAGRHAHPAQRHAVQRRRPGRRLRPSANGSLQQGYLNGSNVDPTQSMMEMIADSRSYQLQTDMMKTQSGSDQSLNTLLAQG